MEISSAVCFLDAKTLLFGSESAVKRAIDRQGKPESSPIFDRIAPLSGKEVAFVSADDERFRNGLTSNLLIIIYSQYFFFISELFVDLNGDIVFQYRGHHHVRDSGELELTGFESIFTHLTGDDLGSLPRRNLGRPDQVLFSLESLEAHMQQVLASGYAVDKAAFDKQWFRMKEDMPNWIRRNQVAAEQAIEEKKRQDAQQAQYAVARTAISLNLIVRAMRRYELRHKCFPGIDSAGLDKSPRGLSWRVHLLPELGQSKLYAEFHLDEAWNSDHNKTLIAKMPPIYGTDLAGSSAIHVFIGDRAPFGEERAVKLADIKDSLIYTAALVEAGPDKAEPWTKPGGIPWNRENPLVELGTIGIEVPVAFFDAGAGWFPASISNETLSKMIGLTDGNPPHADILKWRHVAPHRSDVKR